MYHYHYHYRGLQALPESPESKNDFSHLRPGLTTLLIIQGGIYMPVMRLSYSEFGGSEAGKYNIKNVLLIAEILKLIIGGIG